MDSGTGQIKDQNKQDFMTWWFNEGSGRRQKPEEDLEEFLERLCAEAWSNSNYKTKEQYDIT